MDVTTKVITKSDPEIYKPQTVPQKPNDITEKKHRNKHVAKKMSISTISTMFTQKHSDDKTSSRPESKSGPSSASPSVDLTTSNIFLTSRSIDAEYETMLRKLSGQSNENGMEKLIVESELDEFRIEGYALKSISNRKMSIQEEDEDETTPSFVEIKENDIEETAREYTYYGKKFKDKNSPKTKEHTNYYGILKSADKNKENLFVLSVMYDWDNHKYTLILRTKDGNLFNELDTKDQEINGKFLDPKHFNPELLMMPMFDKLPKEIKQSPNTKAFEEVAAYDKNLFKQTFTFGVIYQKYGQISEKEIFSNSDNSKEFEEFLEFIGQRVSLKNFKKFRGGLDVQDDVTGVESIYENYDGAEIMFHVSTFLPHSERDRQFVERKRHIGNDRVAIVFQDRETLFSPKIIRSKLLHVFMIVQPVIIENETKQYKVSVITRKEVPFYGPELRVPYILKKDDISKRFLLAKLINADYASLRAPAFLTFSDRTIESSLRDLQDVLAIPDPPPPPPTSTSDTQANSEQRVPETSTSPSGSSNDVNNSIQRMRTTFRRLTTRLHHHPSVSGDPMATRKSLDYTKSVYDSSDENGGKQRVVSMNEIDYFSDSGISSTRRGSQDTSITGPEKKTLPPSTATIHYKKNKNNYKRRSGSVSDAIEDELDAQSKQKPRCESISYTMNPLTEVVTPPPTPKPNDEKRKSIVVKSEIKQTPSQATLTPEKPELDRLDSKDLTPKPSEDELPKRDDNNGKEKAYVTVTENESESANKTSWKRAIKSFFKFTK